MMIGCEILSEDDSSLAQHAMREEPLRGMNASLLEHLDLAALDADAHVLDVACGAGALTLPLAADYRRLAVTGVDLDASALEVARERASAVGLRNASFEQMDLEQLKLADASVDAFTSRLGVLLFGSPVAGARELARVLKPGAPFSLALWSDVDDNPYMREGLRVLRRVMSEDALPDTTHFTPLGRPPTVQGWLSAARVRQVHTTMTTWQAPFADFSAWWTYLTSAGPLTRLFAELEDDALQTAMGLAREQVATTNQALTFASRCRIVWGVR